MNNINRQFNLQEVLVKEFNFTQIDLDRYQLVLEKQYMIESLKKLVISIRNNPHKFQSALHKKNTLLKACKNQMNNNDLSSPNRIGDIIKINFNQKL